MITVIPTLGRVGKLKTFWAIPFAYIACPESEVARHKIYHPKANFLPMPDEEAKVHLGHTHQWIMDNAPEDHICVIDDDLTIHTRTHTVEVGSSYEWRLGARLRYPMGFSIPTETQIREMQFIEGLWQELEDRLKEGWGQVIVGPRDANQTQTVHYRVNERCNAWFAYDRRKLKKAGVDFSEMAVMYDFDGALKMLEAGYPNLKIWHTVWNHGKSNTPGGCSTYRTPELQARHARMLHDRHPNCVSVVARKTNWDGWGGERIDVRVQWKKAYTGPKFVKAPDKAPDYWKKYTRRKW